MKLLSLYFMLAIVYYFVPVDCDMSLFLSPPPVIWV